MLDDLDECVRLSEADSPVLTDALRRRAERLKADGKMMAASANFEEVTKMAAATAEVKMRAAHGAAQCRAKAGDPQGAVTLLREAETHLKTAADQGRISAEVAKSVGESIKASMQKLEKKVKKKKFEEEQVAPTESVDDGAAWEQKWCEDGGRFMVASSQGVACGTLLAREDPVTWLLNPDVVSDLWRTCSHCLCACAHVSLPCPGCSSVVYCSSPCRDAALSTYHKYECKVNLCRHRVDGDADSYRIFLSARKVQTHKLLSCTVRRYICIHIQNCSEILGPFSENHSKRFCPPPPLPRRRVI